MPELEAKDVIEKKRGRKPKNVYNSYDIATSVNNCCSDDENIIVRLNISDLQEDKTGDQPYAYNCDEYSNISNIDQDITEIEKTTHLSDLKVVDILKDFEEKNKYKEWPTNTSIHCYWCCHKFDNSPYGIPINYQNEKFNVFGCFCSLECVAAYNFKMNESIDQMWERYNLINMLYRKLNLGKIVKPAPDRIALKIFGGFLDIDAFRQYFKSNKILNINFPPMSSITQQIEEINDYELNNDYKYIPLDTDRINKYKERQLLFKRTKPIVNTNNTLEASMNLSIKYS